MTSDLAATIKSALSMDAVARMYGYEPNAAGFINCPLHNEKTGSVKVYSGDGGWYCFGCKQGGDVIRFVQAVLNISFKDACARLNADFRLGLDLSVPVDTDALRRRREAREALKQAEAKRAARYRRVTDEFRRLWTIRCRENPANWDDMSPEFIESLRRMDGLERWLHENL